MITNISANGAPMTTPYRRLWRLVAMFKLVNIDSKVLAKNSTVYMVNTSVGVVLRALEGRIPSVVKGYCVATNSVQYNAV